MYLVINPKIKKAAARMINKSLLANIKPEPNNVFSNKDDKAIKIKIKVITNDKKLIILKNVFIVWEYKKNNLIFKIFN